MMKTHTLPTCDKNHSSSRKTSNKFNRLHTHCNCRRLCVPPAANHRSSIIWPHRPWRFAAPQANAEVGSPLISKGWSRVFIGGCAHCALRQRLLCAAIWAWGTYTKTESATCLAIATMSDDSPSIETAREMLEIVIWWGRFHNHILMYTLRWVYIS